MGRGGVHRQAQHGRGGDGGENRQGVRHRQVPSVNDGQLARATRALGTRAASIMPRAM
jgi:hypothetical protein